MQCSAVFKHQDGKSARERERERHMDVLGNYPKIGMYQESCGLFCGTLFVDHILIYGTITSRPNDFPLKHKQQTSSIDLLLAHYCHWTNLVAIFGLILDLINVTL